MNYEPAICKLQLAIEQMRRARDDVILIKCSAPNTFSCQDRIGQVIQSLDDIESQLANLAGIMREQVRLNQ
jgi:hypothetical protein